MSIERSPTALAVRAPAEPARQGLALAALGIVFGDIGTSPLYAFREAATAAGGATAVEVMGALSLIAWALLLSVSVKYVSVLLRVDNGGEGGIIALAALLDLHRARRGRRAVMLGVALAGAAMLFGDAMITPAISVLAAVEGLRIAMPRLDPAVLPLAAMILVVLFAIQGAGTELIGRWFGPVMLAWFAAIGTLGAIAVASRPEVLAALDPRHAATLLATHPLRATAILTAVFLAVTGGEALYADLGQFGRRTIARAWYLVVLPALLLSYFGQGALVLAEPHALDSPFYRLVPDALRLPMIALATLATIIASQAVISGIASLARQAMELHLLVPLRVVHTSRTNEHHVYLPALNVLIATGTVLIAVGFGSSGALADAYGLAVAGAMITTTILAIAYLRRRHHRHAAVLVALFLPLLAIDVTFFGSSLGKIANGGWLPLTLTALAFGAMASWHVGRRRLVEVGGHVGTPVPRFAREFARSKANISAPIVALMRPGEGTVASLDQLRRILGVNPDRVVIASVWVGSKPRVGQDDRATVVCLCDGMCRVDLKVGYLQQIDLPSLLSPELLRLGIEPDEAVYLVSHDRLVPPPRIRSLTDLASVAFIVLFRLAERATDRFRLPTTRTLEVGVHKQL
ncbi:KUP/HAK/KT family potassium transporter [Acuticoccus sediminis]|uniref:KUP/HAK/KT family potassium transporter n=1 Tax=Acuticoccus sediminis TaxID=2184697 RepID=UPI001CFD187B|nr:KUP/HAK/KT family potassium transporter [Acuticoccus sediminis]